jgi:hypothetical protein
MPADAPVVAGEGKCNSFIGLCHKSAYAVSCKRGTDAAYPRNLVRFDGAMQRWFCPLGFVRRVIIQSIPPSSQAPVKKPPGTIVVQVLSRICKNPNSLYCFMCPLSVFCRILDVPLNIILRHYGSYCSRVHDPASGWTLAPCSSRYP